MTYTTDSLAYTLAKLVDFAWDDYKPNAPDENIQRSLGYQCACFVAQYTVDGKDGVETEVGISEMATEYNVPFADRLKMAYNFISLFGGVK